MAGLPPQQGARPGRDPLSRVEPGQVWEDALPGREGLTVQILQTSLDGENPMARVKVLTNRTEVQQLLDDEGVLFKPADLRGSYSAIQLRFFGAPNGYRLLREAA